MTLRRGPNLLSAPILRALRLPPPNPYIQVIAREAAAQKRTLDQQMDDAELRIEALRIRLSQPNRPTHSLFSNVSEALHPAPVTTLAELRAMAAKLAGPGKRVTAEDDFLAKVRGP